MSQPFPRLVWDGAEFHRQLMQALDEAYAMIATVPEFANHWATLRTVPGTKTRVRQTPMLGTGASGRPAGGFHIFAQRYVQAEGTSALPARARCSFERYHDFAFFTDGNWYQGKKHPIMIAECESRYGELCGELSGLLRTRCPFKHLFIDGLDTLKRLNAFCNDSSSCAIDWANTTYYVIEIPNSASPPSGWPAFRATVERNGDGLQFRPVV
jgi:hypothetical protein